MLRYLCYDARKRTPGKRPIHMLTRGSWFSMLFIHLSSRVSKNDKFLRPRPFFDLYGKYPNLSVARRRVYVATLFWDSNHIYPMMGRMGCMYWKCNERRRLETKAETIVAAGSRHKLSDEDSNALLRQRLLKGFCGR